MVSNSLQNYEYYNQPEGKDPIGKVVGPAKYGAYFGLSVGIYDAMLYSKCLNAAEFLNTAGYWMVPITGMCVAFSTVTYMATNLRKKDDTLNYIYGALASGAVLHAWLKKPLYSGPGTAVMVIGAALKKDTKQKNYKGPNKNILLPDKTPTRWLLPWRNVYYRDYSLKSRFEHNKTDYYFNYH